MIPKVIHYCWFGGTPKPQSVLRCIRSWKKYCPDFEIREWTEKDFDVTQNKYTQQAYEAKAWGFVPDYIRLWIIYHYGGIYMDTDVQVLKSLTPLLVHNAYAGFERETRVNFGQGFGAEKGNPVIKAHMEMYDSLCFLNKDGSINKTPSPEYTTQCLQQFGLKSDTGVIQELPGITVYPQEYLCPKSFISGLTTVTPNSYSIHQFDASWYDDKQQEAKKQRWKKAKQKRRKNKLKQLLRVTLQRLLGDARFAALKQRIRKK